jgi:hypothetical protein
MLDIELQNVHVAYKTHNTWPNVCKVLPVHNLHIENVILKQIQIRYDKHWTLSTIMKNQSLLWLKVCLDHFVWGWEICSVSILKIKIGIQNFNWNCVYSPLKETIKTPVYLKKIYDCHTFNSVLIYTRVYFYQKEMSSPALQIDGATTKSSYPCTSITVRERMSSKINICNLFLILHSFRIHHT